MIWVNLQFMLPSRTRTVISNITTLYAEFSCAFTFYLECSRLLINPFRAVDALFSLYKTDICWRNNLISFLCHHFSELLTIEVIVIEWIVFSLDRYSTTQTIFVLAPITRENWVIWIFIECFFTFRIRTKAHFMRSWNWEPSWDIKLSNWLARLLEL